MTWALLEIVVPLLLAFGAGILTGWMAWRWRRRSVSAHEWNRLNAGTESALAELASMQAARDEAVNERTALAAQMASVNVDLDAQRTELDLAQRRTAELTGELGSAESRIEDLGAQLSEASTRVTALESGLASARRTIAGLNADGDAEQIERLEATLVAVRNELDGSHARIADLEAMLTAAREVEPDAAVATGASSASPEMAAEIGQLRVELAERDRRIRALEQATRKPSD